MQPQKTNSENDLIFFKNKDQKKIMLCKKNKTKKF